MSASVASSQSMSTRPVVTAISGIAASAVSLVDAEAVFAAVAGAGTTAFVVAAGCAIFTVGALRAASAESSNLSRSISSVSDASTATGAGAGFSSFAAGSAARDMLHTAATVIRTSSLSFISSLLC